MSGWEMLAQAAWKGTVILCLGFAAAYGLKTASAAVRHYLWTVVLAALLLLPLATALSPKWRVLRPARQAVVTVTAGALEAAGGPAQVQPADARPGSARDIAVWIYLAGALLVMARFLAGAVRTRRMLAGGRPARRMGIPRSVRVIESERAPTPLVWGIARPVIVLPETSRSWTAERLRTVLLHELIHVRRRDLLAQAAGQAACCLYWFHPLAWMAARELRKERERACDDAVLERGIGAPEYAGHLVDLVRGMTVEAPAMAEASDFEGRVRALLDRGRNRAPLTRGVAVALAAMACAAILPMAAITSYAQDARGAIAGVVTDPSGARVPGAAVLAKNLDGGNEESAKTNAAGEFVFRSIPAGRYEVQFRVPGFKMDKVQATVTPGSAAEASAALELGEVSEAVTVTGARGPAARPAPAAGQAAPRRIAVGGNVQPVRLVRHTRPVYPEELKQAGITGVVMIRAIVGKDGQLLNPRVVNTDVDPGLAKAALDAVSEWLYEPARLNGQAVETVTSIAIRYELEQ